jgi:hypothetical protein
MAAVNWLGQNKNLGTGNWSNTKEWSTGALPTSTDTALINGGLGQFNVA